MQMTICPNLSRLPSCRRGSVRWCAPPARSRSARLELGRLSFDTASKEVFLNGNAVELCSREREVLSSLLHKAGKVVSKRALTQAISSWDTPVGTNAVEVYIHRLRKKLEGGDVSSEPCAGWAT